jgi:hypothetical protein
MYYIDIGVTVLFSLEAVFKVIVKGLILNGSKSYLRSFGNFLDFIIVVFSLINIFSE